MKKDPVLYICFLVIAIWGFMGISAHVLCSEKPLIARFENNLSFPFLNHGDKTDYKSREYDFVIWAPVPFSASELDMQNTGSRPPGSIQTTTAGDFTHFLGTDHLGRDVMAGLFNGAQVSLLVVAGSMTFTAILGIALGLFMGFYGDKGFRMKPSGLLAFLLAFFIIAFHIGFGGGSFLSIIFWMFFISILWLILRYFFGSRINKPVAVPLDLALSRFIEVFESIPKILLLIAIFAGFLPSIQKVIFLLAITSWPSITRIVRAETLKEKQKQYIIAGITLGFRDPRIIFVHILPNISGPVITHLTYTAGAIILIESALSFLGLGVPPDVVTWGRMLAQAKTQLSAWWLVLFPGFFIFATVFSLNYLGRFLGERYRSESQQKLIL
jgi:peptide/nickel transport system permease protein